MSGPHARRGRRTWRLKEALDQTYVAPRPRLPARRDAAQLLRTVPDFHVNALMSNTVAADALHRACLRLGCRSYVHALSSGCSHEALSEAIEDLES